MTTSPASRYFVAHARVYGSVRSQFTHVNVPNCTSTTLPLRLAAFSGGELIHAVALASDASSSDAIAPLASPSRERDVLQLAARSAAAVVVRNVRRFVGASS